jgi:undecaprenyl-diphosphatase
VLLAISPEARKRWWLIALVLLAAPVIEQVAKHLVGRARPRGSAMGFPSGHMTGAAAFAVIAIYFAIKEPWNRAQRLGLTAVVTVMVVLVGVARLVLHAHWPSDVLGGLLLGSSCAAAGAWWDARRSAADASFRRARGRGGSYGEVRVLDGIQPHRRARRLSASSAPTARARPPSCA